MISNLRLLVFVDRFGFPEGNAASNRVKLICRSLVEKGVSVTVLLSKPSEYEERGIINGTGKGTVNSIEFEYTCGTYVRSGSFILRRFHALKGWGRALLRLIILGLDKRSGKALYLYSDSPGLCIPAAFIAKVFHIPVIVELCEWRPWMPSSNWRIRLYYKYLRFKLADGALVISQYLRSQLETMHYNASRLAMLDLPILTDINEQSCMSVHDDSKYFLWCGPVDANIKEIKWIIRSLRTVFTLYPEYKVVIVGAASQLAIADCASFIGDTNVDPVHLVLCGFVSRRRLIQLYADATALIAPLGDDDRSKARFPTKIGEYLSSKRPLIAAAVGEVQRFFKDGHNAYLYNPSIPKDFSDKILRIIENPMEADSVGLAGFETAKRHFHYQVYGTKIHTFIRQLYEQS